MRRASSQRTCADADKNAAVVEFGFLARAVVQNISKRVELLEGQVKTRFVHGVQERLFGRPKTSVVIPGCPLELLPLLVRFRFWLFVPSTGQPLMLRHAGELEH